VAIIFNGLGRLVMLRVVSYNKGKFPIELD